MGRVPRSGAFKATCLRRNAPDYAKHEDIRFRGMVRKKINAGLKIGYAKKNLFFLNALMLSLGVSNIFDKEFVSVINWIDDTRAGSTSYYVGARFTAMLTVSLEL